MFVVTPKSGPSFRAKGPSLGTTATAIPKPAIPLNNILPGKQGKWLWHYRSFEDDIFT